MLRILILSLLLGTFVANAQAQCTTQNVLEAVVNGNFEQGYVPGQFTTDEIYLYHPSNSAMSTLVDAVKAGGTGSCAWTSATHFEIDKYFGPFSCSGLAYDGHPFLTEGNGRYDHTYGIGGTGKYMMIDGQTGTPTGLGWKLWEQTIPVYANEMYYFSAWFINLTPLSTAGDRVDLRFVVTPLNAGGTPITAPVQLGTAYSPLEASRGNNWEQVYQQYTPPIGTVTVRLGIYNQGGAVNGNDVGIDDISFMNGCSSILSLSIPPAPTLPATLNTCDYSGTITLNSNVGTNAGAGRTFTWFSGTGATQVQLNGINDVVNNTYSIPAVAGTYRVCVYQAGGCAKSATVVITTGATANGPDIDLCNTSALTTTITPSSISPFLTYSWEKNSATWGGSVNSPNVTADGAGTFTVTGVHSNGVPACNVTKTFNVSSTNPATSSGASFCPNASVNLTVAPALANVYRWYDSDGTTIVQAASPTSSTYTTPILTASHTYYVQDVRTSSATLTTTAGGANGWAAATVLNFDLTNTIVLKTVTVMRSGAWQGPLTGTIEVVNNLGVVVGVVSNAAAIADGSATLNMVYTFNGGTGITIPAGTGYKLRFSAGAAYGGLLSQTLPSGSGVSNVSVTGASNVFANWTVDVPLNPCSRITVVATAFCPLPLTMVSFNGYQANGLNQLTWSTVNEINTSVFVVQRSTDGVNFEDVETQTAAGNSSTLLNYYFNEPALSGTTHYRLKQVDVDGAYGYTNIVTINGATSSLGTLLTNPATTVVQVQLTGEHDASVHVSILNIHGVLIFEGRYNGDELVTINTSLTPGVYVVKLEGISSAESHKLIAE